MPIRSTRASRISCRPFVIFHGAKIRGPDSTVIDNKVEAVIHHGHIGLSNASRTGESEAVAQRPLFVFGTVQPGIATA